MSIFESKKELREHLVNLTKELIHFPSHADEPEKIFLLTDFIKSYFEHEAVVIKEYVHGGLPSLVIGTTETKHPTMLLSGHIDVVPSSNRYVALEDGPLLYGSGACDMKGGVAVIMAILKYFSRQKHQPSLSIMLTSDEEVGSEHGTVYLVNEESYRANFVVINEGRRRYDIVTREKGVLILRFRCTGAYTHSAYPWQANNALEDLMTFLVALKKIFPKPKDAWTPTASVTVFHGGHETNTIPAEVEATMNIRLTGGKHWSKDAVLAKIQALMPKNITIVDMSYGEIFMADTKDPYIKLLRKAAAEVLEKPIQFAENHGASDAKIFMSHHIPVAVLGPAGLRYHSPEEAVEIESLVTHFGVLKRFIELEQAREKKLKQAVLKQ